MGKALVFLLVAFGVAALLFWVAAPHVLGPSPPSTRPVSVHSSQTPTLPAQTPPLPATTTAIPPPRSDARREAETVEQQRGPFYAWIKEHWQKWIVTARPAPSDAAVLEIYARHSDVSITRLFFDEIIVPHAYTYGFEKVRIYQPDPASTTHTYILTAEATLSRNGQWTLVLR